MVFRHALVVGSQCEALPNQQLSFLPQRAERLFQMLTDSNRGGCEPAPTSVLLLDPTLLELDHAVEQAVNDAAIAGATLIFAFIGHAETAANTNTKRLFLMPRDGKPIGPTSTTAFELGHRLGELDLGGLDGMILILDACHAGAGIRDTIRAALDLKDHARLELLAGTHLRESRNGCFSKSLINSMEHGQPEVASDYLEIRHVANVAADSCRTVQDPPVYVGSGIGKETGDPGLWVTKNIASTTHWPLSGTAEGAWAVRLTENFLVTSDLEKIIGAMFLQRLVVIKGPAGTGKSTLAGALARPSLCPGLQNGFISAVSFTTLSKTLPQIAQSIHKQLVYLRNFASAETAYVSSFSDDSGKALGRIPALERLVFGPLRFLHINPPERIRIIIDGMDQLDDLAIHELTSALLAATQDTQLERVSFLLSTRDVASADFNVEPITLSALSPNDINKYLSKSQLPNYAAIRDMQNVPSWLDLKILADVGPKVNTKNSHQDHGMKNSSQIFVDFLSANLDPRENLVLAILAAAGAGAVLPIDIAIQAFQKQGGAIKRAKFRNSISVLENVVARSDPGTPEEKIGLIHETLVDEISHNRIWQHAVAEAHRSILAVLEVDNSRIAKLYARRSLPEHYWAIGRYPEAIDAALRQLGDIPADNQDFLQLWLSRTSPFMDANDPSFLKLQAKFSYWKGEAGDFQGGIADLKEVLSRQLGVLGVEHPETLDTRNSIAELTARIGDPNDAILQFQEVLDARSKVLGPEHPDTLVTLSNIAALTGRTGDRLGAIRKFHEILETRLRLFGPNDPSTLITRSNIAALTGKIGNLEESFAQFHMILEARQNILDRDHPKTLTSRSNIAALTGKMGNVNDAILEFNEILNDRLRILGPDDPDTLTTRANIAFWTGKSGNINKAVDDFIQVLGDRLRILGPNHQKTLMTRKNLGLLLRKSGDISGAINQYEQLFESQKNVFGLGHPSTVATANMLEKLRREL